MGIVVPGDIKTKNNLNPGIQGFADGNFNTENIFRFNSPGYEKSNKIHVLPKNFVVFCFDETSIEGSGGNKEYRQFVD